MNSFRILICEDDNSDQINIGLHISTIKRKLNGYDIISKIVNFSEIFDELKGEYDLLILDLFDNVSKIDKGSNVLMHNEGMNKIPTIIYTSTADSLGFDLVNEKMKYSFLIDKFTKIPNSGEELINFLIGYVFTKRSLLYYKLYNENDEKLKLSINYIGKNHFNYILFQFKEKYNISEDIVIYPMASGWSGAVLFKVYSSNYYYVLKLSKDISSLKSELEKSIRLYNSFPTHLINHINPEEFYSFDNLVFGFAIKNVENSIPLLSFILDKSNSSGALEEILDELYFKSNALKEHYSSKKKDKKDWTTIFEKINDGKIQSINSSYKDLEPIIEKYYEKIDVDEFRRLCINHDSKNLNPTKQLDEKYKKELVLSHGDFHAKNILVQSKERPFIIDTGALGYQHWALDIARLITSIFIFGIDSGKIEYFDLERIRYSLELGNKIIRKESIEIHEGEDNYNILHTINWLMNNVETIYETQFSLFEFQLGLLKELLQISYRIATIPPNKRALALMLANICLKEANNNVN